MNTGYQSAPSKDDDEGYNEVKVQPNGLQATAGVWRKLLPLLAITTSSAVAIAVASLQLVQWTGTPVLYVLVAEHRASVQVFVHILSTILTLLWTYAVCTYFNLIARSRFARQAVSLNTLRLWAAISQARYDSNLPFWWLPVVFCFYAVMVLPAWLWTGALTPQLKTIGVSGNATLPINGNGSYPFLQPRIDEAFYYECWTHNQVNGSFTSCPGVYQSGSILDSAASATTIDGSPRNHSKFDNTRFRYSGRSYGAGASVGLTIGSASSDTVQGYSFTETGYLTTVNCTYNASSLWRLSGAVGEVYYETSLPNLFYALGCFPNSNYSAEFKNTTCREDFYAQVSLDGTPDSIVAMGAANSDAVSAYYISIAAGSNYQPLNQSQCRFTFEPTTFAVNVSAINGTVIVKPVGSAPDPEPRGMLRSKLMDAINTISMVQTTLYVSTVGEALMSNVDNYLARESGMKATGGNATEQQTLAALTDSMQAMADDILVSFASAALARTDSSQTTQVHFEALGIEIGSRGFIIAIVACNLMALLLLFATAIVTKFWSHAPAFDFADLGALSAAVALEPEREPKVAMLLDRWEGNAQDPVVGRLMARLRHHVPGEAPTVRISTADGGEVLI